MIIKRKCVTCGNKIKCLSCGDVYEMRNTDIFTGELLLTSECDCGEQLSLCPDCKDGWQEWEIVVKGDSPRGSGKIFNDGRAPEIEHETEQILQPLPPEQAEEVIMEMLSAFGEIYDGRSISQAENIAQQLLDKYQIRRVGDERI